MIKTAYAAWRVFNAVCNRINELAEIIIPEARWDRAAIICDFLEAEEDKSSMRTAKRKKNQLLSLTITHLASLLIFDPYSPTLIYPYEFRF